MLRIHFAAEDLGRVQVATAPDPLWDTVLGLHQLTGPGRGARVFAAWRERARTVLRERGLLGPVRLLRALAPADAYFPDFLTPAAAAEGLASGLDAVMATSERQLRDELQLLAHHRYPGAVPDWLRQLASGDREGLNHVVAAVRAVHDSVIAPDWTGTEAAVESDRALRARAVLDGGTHRLLDTLGPSLRWQPPVLRADYPVERDLHLDGRGLRLIPSYFCWRTPVSLVDDLLQPVLVYPVGHGTTGAAGHRHADALAHLLGRTRARVLTSLTTPATTGELARRLATSAASASQHVHALRDAGLVLSRRDRNHVLHSLTPLGSALASGAAPDRAGVFSPG